MLYVKCQSVVSFHIKGQMLIEEKQRSAAEKSIKRKVLRGLQPPWYKRVIFQADKILLQALIRIISQALIRLQWEQGFYNTALANHNPILPRNTLSRCRLLLFSSGASTEKSYCSFPPCLAGTQPGKDSVDSTLLNMEQFTPKQVKHANNCIDFKWNYSYV